MAVTVRLQSLTEQVHVKIRVKITASLSTTNELQWNLVSLVKWPGSQGVEARIIEVSISDFQVCVSYGAAGPST